MSDELKTTPCPGCGKPIVWGVTVEGTRVPLDPREPVYAYEPQHESITAVRRRDMYVSHFSICLPAN